ncbi:MAG: VirB3 family type IV secretion system protein [Planctomycetota bacterium]
MSRLEQIEAPDGFLQPVRQALIQPVLVAGVPRAFAILNVTVAMALGLGAHQVLIAVPLAFGLHLTAVVLTKRDPLWLDVLLRHLRGPRRLGS